MPKKKKFLIITLLTVSLLAVTFYAGCVFGAVTETDGNVTTPEIAPSEGIDVVGEAWDIIFDEYVDRDKLDVEKLKKAAIEGILEALDDPYTSYLNAHGYEASREGIEGKFEGIGAYVGMKDDRVMIIAPIPDSPAARAGIQSGDIIVGVNGESAEGMSLEEVVLLIRGPKGTTVNVSVLHEGDSKPVDIDIVRDEIRISSVMFRMEDDIAYITIIHFTEQTPEELDSVFETMEAENAAGIVLDLRSNPGGLLESVVDVASHFIDEGTVLKVIDNRGREMVHSVNPDIESTALPMVVLTDNYTASASEVLTGALQDYGRAAIAGTVTYGKGSVNLLEQLSDGSGLYITYARWYTPNGHLIEGKGITPDYELDIIGEEAVQWALDYLRDG